MPTFNANLTGANCHLSGQTIISLQATEDIDADYDTASAVCLAPSGTHTKGAIVQTVEGGVSTGWWHVDEVVRIRSGERTWRKRQGANSYAHLPLCQYRLRRSGYLAARSTISAANIGSDNFPAKWCPQDEYQRLSLDLFLTFARGEIDFWEYSAAVNSWRPVAGAADVIRQICSWVGLPVTFRCSLPVMAPEYEPIGKPAITACREVASWSGASCYLNRTGTLVVYDWMDTFARGGRTVPMPAALLSEEEHDAIFPANVATVIGSERFWAHTPATWNPETRTFDGGGWGWQTQAVEVSEYIARAQNERPVEERLEIRDHFITPELARRVARERLGRIALQAGVGRWRGPAEGSQAYCPLDYHVFEITRSLEWTGAAYRYEIEIAGPRSAIAWPDEGWDF